MVVSPSHGPIPRVPERSPSVHRPCLLRPASRLFGLRRVAARSCAREGVSAVEPRSRAQYVPGLSLPAGVSLIESLRFCSQVQQRRRLPQLLHPGRLHRHQQHLVRPPFSVSLPHSLVKRHIFAGHSSTTQPSTQTHTASTHTDSSPARAGKTSPWTPRSVTRQASPSASAGARVRGDSWCTSRCGSRSRRYSLCLTSVPRRGLVGNRSFRRRRFGMCLRGECCFWIVGARVDCWMCLWIVSRNRSSVVLSRGLWSMKR